MVTDQEIVQWGYLLDPCFELTNTAGKPLTNGWIEVYIQGTRKKYYCASDFNGTLHPFKIPLDSLGSNIVLADPNKAYDVYVYNMFGSLVMSRYNVSPGHASGTAVVSGGDAEHWIGHGGSSVTVESGTYSSPLPLPSSPDYEGTFVDRVVDNEMVLKNGVYLFDAVIRFRQNPQDLTNTIRDLSIHTGLSDTETTVYEMDGAGPDADVDNIHQIRVQFIRHVDSEYNNIFHLQMRSPNDLQFALIQNLSIIKLGGGSASGGSHGGDYEAGDYVEITDENVINVTGLQPAGNYVSGTTYSHDMYDVNQQLGALSGQIREVSGAIPSLEGYATQDWVEEQGYLTEVPSQYVTETEMQSAISGKADTSAIPSLEGYATEDWVNEQGFIKEVPSQYVTDSEMSGYVQEQTSGFITSADLPDVSDMATKTWVTDQHYITSADIPPQVEYSAGDNIDITNHIVSVTDTSLLLAGENVSITPSGNDYIISAQVPETSAFVTGQEMNDAIQSATSAFITSADIPDLPDDLVTSGELATVSGEIVNQIPSLDGYATEEYVADYVTEHTSAFLTSADLPDVSDMATKTWVGEQGYLTSIPSEYITETELESELSGKADTSAIPDVSNFVTQEDIDAAVSGKMDATESSAFYPMATNPSGYLVSSDLNGYATESYVQDQTSAFVDSDYVNDYVASQTSGKQDKLTFEYNEESAISAINGSALAGGSSFDPSVLDAYIPYSAAGVTLENSNFKIDTNGQAYKGAGSSSIDFPLVHDSSTQVTVNGPVTLTQYDTLMLYNYSGYQNGTFLLRFIQYQGSIETRYDRQISVAAGSSYVTLPYNDSDPTHSIPTGTFDRIVVTCTNGYSFDNLVFNRYRNAPAVKYATVNDLSAAIASGTSGKQDTLTFGYDESDKINAINGSAIAGGGSVPEGVMVESGLQYNAVGEISGYGESAIAQYGAEKQWLVHDDTIVHMSNSAQYAFGVNLSAVAQLLGVDETVLWTGEPSTGNISLSESVENFNQIRVYGKWHYNGSEDSGRGIDITSEQLVPTSATSFQLFGFGPNTLVNTNSIYLTCVDYRLDGTTLIRRSGIRVLRDGGNSSTSDTIEAYKVVGIGRKQSN